MKNFLYLIAILFICSCQSDKYNIEGTCSLAELEGKQLFLKVYENEDLVNIDSTCIKDGKFHFSGKLDSTLFVNVFIEDRSLMPLVLEKGDIKVEFRAEKSTIGGTELNDSLYNFLQQKSQIDNLLYELPRKESMLIMQGYDHNEIVAQLNKEAENIQLLNERLMAQFIKQNYKNVLGPGIFMLMTSIYPYPSFTTTVEEIIIGAPESFRANPYVRDYIEMARENANAKD